MRSSEFSTNVDVGLRRIVKLLRSFFYSLCLSWFHRISRSIGFSWINGLGSPPRLITTTLHGTGPASEFHTARTRFGLFLLQWCRLAVSGPAAHIERPFTIEWIDSKTGIIVSTATTPHNKLGSKRSNRVLDAVPTNINVNPSNRLNAVVFANLRAPPVFA